MVDARKFLLSSDYPTDQIAGFLSGSFTIANGVMAQVEDYPHTLGFTPLPVGSWSNTAAFDTSYPAITDFNGNGARPGISILANGSLLRVIASNNTGSSQTIYWRAFCLIPSTADPDVDSTSVDSTEFTFNTDYNYTKLLSEGYVTSTSTVNHDLGYRPQVAVWAEYGTGFVGEYEISDSRLPLTEAVEVTTTTVTFTLGGSYAGIHYRIYADD